MPTIDAALSDLARLVGGPFSLEALQRALPLVKGELKGAREGEDALRIELNDTNRPDLWSPEGIARQIRVHRHGRPAAYPFLQAPARAERRIEADPAPAFRPYVGGFIARGPAVTAASLANLIQTQEKLAESYGRRRRGLSMGIYRADRVAFPVRYRAVGRAERRFVPLGFDREMTLEEILKEHPKGKEYAGALPAAGPVPILEDAKGGILSFPPVINSRATGEVAPGDAALFVEMTAARDSFTQMLVALNIVAVDLADRGFRVEPVATRYGVETPLGREVASPHPLSGLGVREGVLSVEHVRDLLGLDATLAEIEQGLAAYGVETEREGDETLRCWIPAYRADRMHPVDLAEDYLLSRGLDAVAPRMPEDFTVGRLDPLTELGDAVRTAWIGLGFEEIFSNVLSSARDLSERLNRPADGIVRILNPYSESYAALRDTLLGSLLRVEAASSQALYPHRIFELGEVEVRDPAAPAGCRTDLRLGALIAHPEASVSELQGCLAAFLQHLGARGEVRPAREPGPGTCIAGRKGEILVGGRPAGWIGEIHASVREAASAKVPCAALEISIAPLAQALSAPA